MTQFYPGQRVTVSGSPGRIESADERGATVIEDDGDIAWFVNEDITPNERDDVSRAIHLAAAAADAKLYASWVIENANLALNRLAEDGIYSFMTTAEERVNPLKAHIECNYPSEKIHSALRDLTSAVNLTNTHLGDAEHFTGEAVER